MDGRGGEVTPACTLYETPSAVITELGVISCAHVASAHFSRDPKGSALGCRLAAKRVRYSSGTSTHEPDFADSRTASHTFCVSRASRKVGEHGSPFSAAVRKSANWLTNVSP